MEEQNPTTSESNRRKSRGHWHRIRRNRWVSFAFTFIATVVVLALLQTFFIRLYVVPSGSMETTLAVGDRILVNRTAYAGGVPPRGDVIVFAATGTWLPTQPTGQNLIKDAVRYFGDLTSLGPSHSSFLVKRVIGIPGDVVDCCSAEGSLTVNGKAQVESYIYQNLPFDVATSNCSTTPRSMRCFPSITVPDGELLVLGDHRDNSNDSVYACRGKDTVGGCLKLVPVNSVIGRTFATVFPLNRIGAVP